MLVLIGVAFFLALGLEPAASWFVNRRLPRWAATTLVFVIFLAVMGAFVAAAIPPLAQQAGDLINQAPHYLQQAQDHSSAIGRLNDRFHLQQRITDAVNGSGGSVLNEVVSAGTAVFGALADSLIVIVLTVYFLVDMPRIRTTLYRLVPHTRRPRAILIGDEVFAKVGAYVLGNVLISVIAGAATFIWLHGLRRPLPAAAGHLRRPARSGARRRIDHRRCRRRRCRPDRVASGLHRDHRVLRRVPARSRTTCSCRESSAERSRCRR